MKTERLIEFEIKAETLGKITHLLKASFEDYPERAYYKQLPHFRYLAWKENQLIGHLGVDYRMMLLGEQPIRVFGLIDLCVAKSEEGKGIASLLLKEVEMLAKEANGDFILLFADDHRLYQKNGYQLAPNLCFWLKMNEHQNYGIGEASFSKSLMYKAVGSKTWENEPLDLLGYLY